MRLRQIGLSPKWNTGKSMLLEEPVGFAMDEAGHTQGKSKMGAGKKGHVEYSQI
jgi:hypothetical protein